MGEFNQPGTSAGGSVAARLHAEVAAARLEPDAMQDAAARKLDALREALLQSASMFERLRAAVTLSARPAPRGLYMWGGVGRGKTLLMDLFFASLENAEPAAGGSWAQRSHFYRFMREVHAELAAVKQQAAPLELVAERIAARTRVICLDEFFVADIADAMILSGLFESLFRRGVTLVTTSNQAPEDLYKDGLQRARFLPAIELIRANLDVLHLDGGTDYRLRHLEQAPTYLDASSASAQAALDTLFRSLAGASAACPRRVSIAGRELNAIDSGPGMLWFEFRELCDGPRSQIDYIELARLCHTVFISHIPVFTEDDRDAARRFIMLIDEFYDRGVKIVVSAEAPPDGLYRGERLRGEFERAASRLIEMQSRQYLAGQHRP